MPILDPVHISTWYHFTDTNSPGTIRLFENWEERHIQQVSDKPLMQSDIGTHVMDVGGLKWSTRISSPAIIVETSQMGQVTSILDIAIDTFNLMKSRAGLVTLSNLAVPYLLKEATINIRQEGVSCDAELWSDTPGIFTPYSADVPFEFIGRVARFYDIRFGISNVPLTNPILEGTIKISCNISENFFVNTGTVNPNLSEANQRTYFGVQGYEVSGNVTVLCNPSNPNDFLYYQITPQIGGNFDVVGFSNSVIEIYNGPSLSIGRYHMNDSISRVMRADDLTKVNFSFKNFAVL